MLIELFSYILSETNYDLQNKISCISIWFPFNITYDIQLMGIWTLKARKKIKTYRLNETRIISHVESNYLWTAIKRSNIV